MNTIEAKNYKSRNDLENYIKNTTGNTPDIKVDVIIEGTKEELAKLQLSENSLIWGIRIGYVDNKGKKLDKVKKINYKTSRQL